MKLVLTDQKGLSNGHKTFQTSKVLYKDPFALVKDYFSFSSMSKDWKLKIELKSTLNIFLQFFLKILVHVQNSLA